MADAVSSPADLIRGLLDRGYTAATQQVVAAISTPSPVVNQRMADLQQEAIRLQAAGERLRPDNAVLRALLADLEPQLRRNAAQVDGAAPSLQRNAADAAGDIQRALALPGLSDNQLAQIGIQWNRPDPDAVARLVDYANQPAWADQIGGYAQTVLDVVRNQAIRGIAEGWSPLRTAMAISEMIESVPLAQAQTLMRTLQLTVYRDATVAHQVANAALVETVIRIAALDRRTCLTCIALHGTELALGERVNDHHNGRCTSVVKVRGRDLQVQRGEDWFASLPPDRQAQQLSFAQTPAKWLAYQAGAVTLRDFVTPYQDAVFGDMVREASLAGVLGTDAQQYYVRR